MSETFVHPPQASSLTYSFSWGYRVLVYLSVVVFFALSVGSVYVGVIDRDVPNPHALFVVGLGVLFMLCGIYSLASASRLGEIITVTDTHITQAFANGFRVTLRWSEITTVKHHRFLGRIELLAEQPKRKIRLEYQLHNFAALMTLVEQYVAASTAHGN